MNTSASPLTAYDIVVAQVEASVGQSLHDISDELSNSIPALKAYSEPSDLLLQVTALLQDKTATRSTFLSRDFGSRLIDTWPEAKKGISRAVTFLGEERIFDYQRLPTDVVLAPLATLWSLVPDGLDAEGEARLLLKKYLWRSFFTDRYERTSATRALADFRSLSALIKGVSTAAPLIFDDELHPLPDVEEFIVAGWPKRRDRLPRALLAAALNAGGIDFADGSPCTRESVLNREYHHLFPVAHLSDSWLDSAINRSLNCALITWKTNRSISAKSPAHYITDRMEASSIGETAVRQRLDSHLIPYDELMAGDYEAFLSARAELLHNRMKRLCEGIAIASD